MKFKAIHTDDEHAKALAQIEKLLGAEDGSQEQSDLEVLSILVEAYERQKYAISDADPIEMLEFAFEQQMTLPEQKARIFGGANRASEVMSRKRRLTITMIRRAHEELGLPLDVLVRDYPVGDPRDDAPSKQKRATREREAKARTRHDRSKRAG